jgi:hypothetical protein
MALKRGYSTDMPRAAVLPLAVVIALSHVEVLLLPSGEQTSAYPQALFFMSPCSNRAH